MIGVVAALDRELGSFTHPRAVLAFSGMGYERARAAAEKLCSSSPPELLVSAGCCGAIVGGLETGTLIAGGTVRDGRRFAPDPRAAAVLPAARTGDTLWVPAVTRTPPPAPAGVLAVDMESAAVAEVAAARGLPFLMLRAVLDTPDAPLAADYRWTTLLKPWQWIGIPRDLRRLRTAARALSDGLTRLADSYPVG